jgi:MinD superfamily P-loop ATPase
MFIFLKNVTKVAYIDFICGYIESMTWDFMPQIDSALCIGCELCVKACPHQVLAWCDNRVFIANLAACEYTGACEAICPTGAISLRYEIVLGAKIDISH